MKFTVFVVLILANVVIGFGQTISVSSGITVINKRWYFKREANPIPASAVLDSDSRREGREGSASGGIGKDGFPSLRVVPTKDGNIPSRYTFYRYEIAIKNNNPKTIKTIVWEYIFLKPETGEELGRRRFSDKVKIKSGKEKKLIERSVFPPTGTINAAGDNNQYDEEIKIREIVYSDNSVWQFKK